MDRIGYIYFNGVFAGKLYELKEGFCFEYDSDYVLTGTPIGFNYPVSKVKYFGSSLFPIFENLLSEGWLLDLQSSTQHIDKNDKLGILLNNGKDLVGSITVLKDYI